MWSKHLASRNFNSLWSQLNFFITSNVVTSLAILHKFANINYVVSTNVLAHYHFLNGISNVFWPKWTLYSFANHLIQDARHKSFLLHFDLGWQKYQLTDYITSFWSSNLSALVFTRVKEGRFLLLLWLFIRIWNLKNDFFNTRIISAMILSVEIILKCVIVKFSELAEICINSYVPRSRFWIVKKVYFINSIIFIDNEIYKSFTWTSMNVIELIRLNICDILIKWFFCCN